MASLTIRVPRSHSRRDAAALVAARFVPTAFRLKGRGVF